LVCNETPEINTTKGDHLVGKYDVAFDVEFKSKLNLNSSTGMSKDVAYKKAPITRCL
jgi:arginyl-tRNA synthetase